ncbi:hypothetical protein Sru01_19580 [Sphaerisporangium rufum]|uniref:YCII-related domain-containing protein n=1 Tax=Sphaerisporangium rufum TaxID=1381558 RepID=A0A919UXG1_9ACTN|nr:YciI family protein [Sphaerisporangium rufum]GII76976.1 hypothetical protein Sru01_19580 [Sphaerisporangium rufum]
MKYMLLMQFGPQSTVPPMDTWAPGDVEAHIAFMRDLDAKLNADGEMVEAQGLAEPDQALIVRAGAGGAPAVLDGPFPETKEFLFGYWIVDVDTRDRAVEIAAAISAAPGPDGAPLAMPIEVRQIMVGPPGDL